jgi:hypothetical protein
VVSTPLTTSNVTKTVESTTVEVPAKVISAPTVVSSVSTTTTQSATTTAKPAKKMSVFKYIMLALGVALLISLVGGGIVISQQALTDKKNPPLQTPISSVSPTEKPQEPTPTPKPTDAPVDLKKLNVLVVNATSVAGKASKVAALVKKAGVKTVDAGNAKDKYTDTGTFIMIAKPELSGAQSALEKETGMTFTVQDMSKKENPDEKYDIVIVLNE